MKEQTLNRQQLYNLVWSNPFTALAKKFAISDSGLRKICIKMGIPLPITGHWAKAKYNKSVKIIKLPERHKGDNEVTLFLREEGDPGIKGLPSPFITLTQEITANEGSMLSVPERLVNPCNFIVLAKDSLEKTTHSSNYGGLFNTSSGEINIKVSRVNIGRALRFMDTFIKLMEKRGHRIYIRNSKSYLVIQEEDFEIHLYEILKRVPTQSDHSWERYDFLPTGVLAFYADAIFTRLSWKDGKIPLEEQLAKIIAKLEIKGEELRKNTIERELHWAKQRKKEHRKELKEKRKQKEYAGFLSLFKEFSRWREAENIRAFINLKEMNAIHNNNLTEDLKKQFLWARSKADWYDPLISAKDKFLGFYDEDNLPSLKDFEQEDNDNFSWSTFSNDYNPFKKSFYQRR